MDLRRTIADLYEEKAKLDRVISSLEQLAETELAAPVTPLAHRRGRKFMSPQERSKVSERMRRYWASRRAGHANEQQHIMGAASAA
jgi:hypothetical protein